nr:ABC transporter ATP-binding protein [Candidatus Sigynarchaeota archaeon]
MIRKMTKAKEDPSNPETWGTWKVFRGLMHAVKLPYKQYPALFVLSIASSVQGVIFPLILRALINAVINVESLEYLLTYLFWLVFVSVMEIFVAIVSNYAFSRLGITVMNLIRQRLFDHIQQFEFGYFHSRRKGKIVNYLTEDVGAVNAMISTGLIQFLVQLVQFAGSMVVIFFLSWQMSLFIVILIPVMMLVNMFYMTRGRKLYIRFRERLAQHTATIQEIVDGFRTIKAVRCEDRIRQRYHEKSQALWDSIKNIYYIWSTHGPVLETIANVSRVLIMFIGAWLILDFGIGDTGTVVAFVIYLATILMTVAQITGFFSQIQNGIVAGGRILKLLSVQPEIKEPPAERRHVLSRDARGNIKFDHVHFAYDLLEIEGDHDAKPGEDGSKGDLKKGPEVLTDISFDIAPKQRVAIVGPTGAGKTTIVNLIPRFYDVIQGRITIDGVDVRDYAIDSLHHNIGMVFQDNFLFYDTVMENIKYGAAGRDASDEECINAAKLIGAHDFIEMLPKGYQTVVGERGAILSIGQKQLIAFARAIINNPPILILDEATSSVDAYSELIIQHALRSILQERTSIIIAHRLSTIVSADVILVLDKGKIVEYGNHASLIAQNGLYKKLYQLQFAEGSPHE